MKIICLPDCFIKPDTALLRNGEPFYAPSSSVLLRRGRVVRICRLAKCVEERFAHRCYDASAQAVDFTADFGADSGSGGGFDGSGLGFGGLYFGRAFDHSLAVAPAFEPLSGDALVSSTPTEVAFRAEVDRAIAHITRHVTLKIGDYIFLPSGDAEPLTPETAGLWFEIR